MKLKEIGLSYTDTKPIEFDQVNISPEELAELTEKIYAFATLPDKNKKTARLILSDNEVNALIGTYKDFEKLKGRIRFSFQDNKINGRVSIPLEMIFGDSGKGRYLNGSATFKASCENGMLVIVLDSLKVKGKEIPDIIMTELKNTNLAMDLYDDAETAKIIQRIKRLEVKDDNLIIEVWPKDHTGTAQ